MRILAIESTCDETGVAVVEKFGKGVKVLTNVVASSMDIHTKYGGVVPEVAAREQIKSIIPVITEAIKEIDKIDAIAVASGPGLMGSLLIGVETAKALAWAWNKPLIAVNHMVAHVMANWLLDDRSQITDHRWPVPEFPAVGLVVSGGHTDFIYMKDMENWNWIGGTRDDAVGEAFDKVARLLGLPYPGGPEIDKSSQRADEKEWKEFAKKNKLPRPLINDPSLDMSFSGLKAAVARMTQDYRSQISDPKFKGLVAREFTEAVSEVLVSKLARAIEKYQPKSVILAGGVAANSRLRERLRIAVEQLGISFFVPELKYCGDNAAMVGAAALMRPTTVDLSLTPDPGLGVV